MAVFNYSTRELTTKIVYYGPGLCGKTTNLQYVYDHMPQGVRGKMLSLATKSDRTLFFDFLPIDLGQIQGMNTKVQLYTVPGQVFYNETRRLVLKGADGVVFVADSQDNMVDANTDSFQNLEENLAAHGLTLAELPHVLQYNKQDLPNASSVELLNEKLNRYNAPFYEAIATTGVGVQETLRHICKLVLIRLNERYGSDRSASSRATGLDDSQQPVGAGVAATAPPAAAMATQAAPQNPAPTQASPIQAPPAAPPQIAQNAPAPEPTMQAPQMPAAAPPAMEAFAPPAPAVPSSPAPSVPSFEPPSLDAPADQGSSAPFDFGAPEPSASEAAPVDIPPLPGSPQAFQPEPEPSADAEPGFDFQQEMGLDSEDSEPVSGMPAAAISSDAPVSEMSFEAPADPGFEPPAAPSFELPDAGASAFGDDSPAATPAFSMDAPVVEEAATPGACFGVDDEFADTDNPFGQLAAPSVAPGASVGADDVLGIQPPPPIEAPEPPAVEAPSSFAPAIETGFDDPQAPAFEASPTPATDTLQIDRSTVNEVLGVSAAAGAVAAASHVAAGQISASAQLLEVSGQDALFNEPNVDPTQVSEGHPQEVLVPVEIHDGQQIRRYRLVVRVEVGS